LGQLFDMTETSQLADVELAMDLPVTVKLLRIGICFPLAGEVIFTICSLISPYGGGAYNQLWLCAHLPLFPAFFENSSVTPLLG
jgi:hypothetical protein